MKSPNIFLFGALTLILFVAAIPVTVQYLTTYDTVADMAANANPDGVFKSAYCRGYAAAGDGGGGYFVATNTVTSTNAGTRIKSVGHTQSWEAILESGRQLNVKRFGAKGDNSTDDRTAILNALNALQTGMELHFPPGTFLMSTNVSLTKSDFKIVGSGLASTIIKYSGSAYLGTFLAITGDRWELRGCQIDGNQKIDWPLHITGDDWSVSDNWIKNAYVDDNIDPGQATVCADIRVTKGSTGWTIFRNKITDVTIVVAGARADAGVLLTDFGYSGTADNIHGTILGNWFENIGDTAAEADGNCVLIDLTSGYNNGVKIEGNDFRKFGRRGVKLIGDGSVVVGNNFDNTAGNGARSAISIYGSGNVFTGNTIIGTFVHYGVEVGTPSFEVSGNVVNNNTFKFSGAPSAGLPIGIFFWDNTFNSSASHNIVNNAAYHTELYGNVVNCLFDDLIATNLINDVVRVIVGDHSTSPQNCTIGTIRAQQVAGVGINIVNGTNIVCDGSIRAFNSSGSLVQSISLAGTSASRIAMLPVPQIIDWNGDVVVGGMRDDCISPALTGGIGWVTSTANSGTASTSSIISANHSGLYAVSDGGNLIGVGNIRSSGNNILFGTKKKRYIACVHTPTNLSDGTDTYEIFHGFGDATTGANTDGAFFDYTHTLNSGNWTGKTMSGGSSTTASGGSNVAVTANADWWLGIEGDSKSVKFYVASDSSGVPGTWTLIGTSSSNLPSVGATGLIHEIVSGAGTRTDTFYMDLVIVLP